MVTCLQIVHQKTAACLCLTTVKNEDKMEFSKVLEAIKVRDDCSSSFAKIFKNKFLTVCMVGL